MLCALRLQEQAKPAGQESHSHVKEEELDCSRLIMHEATAHHGIYAFRKRMKD